LVDNKQLIVDFSLYVVVRPSVCRM